jgi:hypothetical protein
MTMMEPFKLPGSPTPEEGNCGGMLHVKGDDDPRRGRFCTRPAGWGTTHAGIGKCKLHGGGAPNHIKHAEKIKVKKEVTRLQEMLGKPTSLKDPYVELWDLTAEVKQWYEISRDLMSELEDVNPNQDRTGVEHTRELIAMFERAQLMLRDTLLAIAKLDLARRLVDLEEAQAFAIGRAVLGVTDSPELGLTDDQLDIAHRLLGSALKDLAPVLRDKGMPNWDEVETITAEIEVL